MYPATYDVVIPILEAFAVDEQDKADAMDVDGFESNSKM